MKTIITALAFFTITIANTIAAQSSSYEKGMSKAFELWKANTPDEAIHLFERIAKAEKEN